MAEYTSEDEKLALALGGNQGDPWQIAAVSAGPGVPETTPPAVTLERPGPDATEDENLAYSLSRRTTTLQPGAVDEQSGVSAKARFAMSRAPDMADKIATLRKYYPAINGEEQVWVERVGGPRFNSATGVEEMHPLSERILFKNPKTGQVSQVNPTGLDVGDIAEAAIPVGRAAVFGGAAALSGGGAILPMVIGTAASQGLDVAADQYAKHVLDTVDSRSVPEQVWAQVVDAVTEGGLALIGGVVGKQMGTEANIARNVRQARRVGVKPAAGTTRRAEDVAAMADDIPAQPGLMDDVATPAPRAFPQATETAGADLGRPDILKDLKDFDVPLEGAAPLVTRNPQVLGNIEAFSKHPDTAALVRRQMDATAKGLEEKWWSTLGEAGYTGAKKEAIGGGAVADIAETGASVSARQRVLETEWREAMGGPDVKIPVANTQNMLRTLESTADVGAAGKHVMGSPSRDLLETITENPEGLPLDFLRKFRTRAGENGSTGKINVTSKEKEWDDIYRVITDDFKAAAAQSPESAAAWEATQANWRVWAKQREAVKNIANSNDGLAAFYSAIQGNKDALTRFRATKETVEPETWNALRTEYMAQLASNPKSGELEISRWFGSWGKLDDSIKDVLAAPDDPLRSALDRMARIGGAQVDANWMKNWSNTASGSLYLQALDAPETTGKITKALVHPYKTTATAVAAAPQAIANRLSMTKADKVALLGDAKFVEWLADSTKIKPGDVMGAGLHLDKLGKYVGTNLGAAYGREDLELPLMAYINEIRNEIDTMLDDKRRVAGGGKSRNSKRNKRGKK